MDTITNEQNTIVLPEPPETTKRQCSFALCCKCCDGVCTLDPALECDFEIQKKLLSDWLPAIVKAHVEQDSNVVRIRAEGAAFMLRHSGNEAAAEILTQLAQEIKPVKRSTAHSSAPVSPAPIQPAPRTGDGLIGFRAGGRDSVYGLKFEIEFREVLDRSEDDEVIRYAVAFWNIIHGQGISVTTTVKGKNDSEVAAKLRDLSANDLRVVCHKLFEKTVGMWVASGGGVNGAKSIITEKLRPVFHADD